MKGKEKGPAGPLTQSQRKLTAGLSNPQGQYSAQPLIVAFYLPLKGTDFHDSTDFHWLLELVCVGHSVGVFPQHSQ